MSLQPTVAVLNPGNPSDRSVWSGTPSGIVDGLRAAGARVVPISVDLPGRAQWLAGAALAPRYLAGARPFEGRSRAQVAHSTAQISAPMARLRAARGRRALSRLTPDGAVAINFALEPPTGVRTVSFEDMTIRQAVSSFDYAHWRALPAREIERRIARQRAGYHAVHACCVSNSWAGRSIVSDYGVEAERVHVVGVGSNFAPAVTERDWRTPRFLFVGREWDRKNGPAVVRAFRRVRSDWPNAELHLVGGHPPVEAPGVTGHGVLRLGQDDERAQLWALFLRATCFVMPSLLEPSAVAYTEAAAAGLGSIGTRNGGSADLIGDAGIVVNPNDDDEIAMAMLTAADPIVAADMGARAQQRAELLTWRAVGARILAALELGPPAAPLITPGGGASSDVRNAA